MNLADYKRKNTEVFKKVKNSNQYIVYYANTEVCTSEVYISIVSSIIGYISEDNRGLKQNVIRAGNQKDALINHLFMNNNQYTDIQGIEYN